MHDALGRSKHFYTTTVLECLVNRVYFGFISAASRADIGRYRPALAVARPARLAWHVVHGMPRSARLVEAFTLFFLSFNYHSLQSQLFMACARVAMFIVTISQVMLCFTFSTLCGTKCGREHLV